MVQFWISTLGTRKEQKVKCGQSYGLRKKIWVSLFHFQDIFWKLKPLIFLFIHNFFNKQDVKKRKHLQKALFYNPSSDFNRYFLWCFDRELLSSSRFFLHATYLKIAPIKYNKYSWIKWLNTLHCFFSIT